MLRPSLYPGPQLSRWWFPESAIRSTEAPRRHYILCLRWRQDRWTGQADHKIFQKISGSLLSNLANTVIIQADFIQAILCSIPAGTLCRFQPDCTGARHRQFSQACYTDAGGVWVAVAFQTGAANREIAPFCEGGTGRATFGGMVALLNYCCLHKMMQQVRATFPLNPERSLMPSQKGTLWSPKSHL